VRTTSAVRFTGPDTGEWVTLTALLPEGLCHASATVVTDGAGKPWIMLTGGSLRSVPNLYCAGGYAGTPRTLMLDPSQADPAWIDAGATPVEVQRFGAATAPSSGGGAVIFGGAVDATLPGAALGDSELLFASDGGMAALPGGALPEARFLAAAATVPGAGGHARQIVAGGATTLGPDACTAGTAGDIAGSSTMWTRDDADGAITKLGAMPSARVGHVAVTGFAGGRQRVWVIGGADGTTPAWDVDEYTP
jgi:hypothetical protein